MDGGRGRERDTRRKRERERDTRARVRDSTYEPRPGSSYQRNQYTISSELNILVSSLKDVKIIFNVLTTVKCKVN